MPVGFPEYSDSFLAGQDLLYGQFNDIEFYVEDIDQHHLYFNILKKLFPDLSFQKIFPLNTKKNVKDAARLNQGNKKKIYIVDSDFDHLLGKCELIHNLFYLDRYSIENYLFERGHFYEIIRVRNPRLKNDDIDLLYDHNLMLEDAAHCLTELACAFIVITKYDLGLDYYGISYARDFDFTATKPTYRMNFINDYLTKVDIALKVKDARYSLKGQSKKLKSHFLSLEKALANIPGKYILLFLKDRLHRLGLIYSMELDGLTYSLSKEFNPNNLDSLKTRIRSFIK